MKEVILRNTYLYSEMARLIHELCKTFTDCSGCQFYCDGCTIYGVPSEWEVEE